MALLRGKLLAGALFAGALFGAAQIQEAVQPAVRSGGGFAIPVAPKTAVQVLRAAAATLESERARAHAVLVLLARAGAIEGASAAARPTVSLFASASAVEVDGARVTGRAVLDRDRVNAFNRRLLLLS